MEVHDDGRREGDLGCADLAGDHGHHGNEKSVSEKLLAAHGDDASSRVPSDSFHVRFHSERGSGAEVEENEKSDYLSHVKVAISGSYVAL